MFKILHLIILLILVSVFSACSKQVESVVVRNTIKSKPIVRQVYSSTLDERLSKDTTIINAVRLTTRRAKKNYFIEPRFTSRYKMYGLLDVALEMKKKDDVIIYRFIITPFEDISQNDINKWDKVLNVTLSTHYTLESYLPKDRTLKNNQVVTKWTSCPTCFKFYKNKIVDYTRGINFIRDYSITSLYFRKSNYSKIAVGLDKALKNREKTIKILVLNRKKLNKAKEYNRKYRNLIYQYKKITMDKYIGKNCGYYRFRPNTNQNASYQNRYIKQNKRYIRCVKKAIKSYDLALYLEKYPDFLKKEKELRSKTYDIKLTRIETAQEQLETATDYISSAYKGIKNIRSYQNRLNRKYAAKERQSQMWNNALNNFKRDWNNKIAKMQNDRLIVSKNGITTVGKQKQNQINSAKINALIKKVQSKNKYQSKVNTSSKTVSSSNTVLNKSNSLSSKKVISSNSSKNDYKKTEKIEQKKLKEERKKQLEEKKKKRQEEIKKKKLERERLKKQREFKKKQEKQRKERQKQEYLTKLKNEINLKAKMCYKEHHIAGFVPKYTSEPVECIDVYYTATCRTNRTQRTSGFLHNMISNPKGSCFGDTKEVKPKLNCDPKDYEVKVTSVKSCY